MVPMLLRERLDLIQKELSIACRKLNITDVTLVGVTKKIDAKTIKEAIDSGLKNIGENRISEAEKKLPSISGVTKHLIGHLQGNKTSKAVDLFDMIQSVDSLKIANKVSNCCIEKNKVMPVLVQIKTDKEKDFGILPKDIEEFIIRISQLERIKVQGLMTIGPYFSDPKQSRPHFKEMKVLFDSLKSKNIPNVEMRYLSMGMSHDYIQAVEEGANMVRIGQVIFEK